MYSSTKFTILNCLNPSFSKQEHAAKMMWRELIRICTGGGGHRTTDSLSLTSSQAMGESESPSGIQKSSDQKSKSEHEQKHPTSNSVHISETEGSFWKSDREEKAREKRSASRASRSNVSIPRRTSSYYDDRLF